MSTDLFSHQASFYAQYRPHYPDTLFNFLNALVTERTLAWDVATGNGQAANALAAIFKQVHATDISEQQLSHAIQRPNISYHMEPAEKSSLPNNAVDAVTVATALHWFNRPLFYQEVDRVLKKNGILFVWSYGGCRINPDIDKIIDHFNFEQLEPYWHEGAKMNWHDKYQSIQLPFNEIPTPDFISQHEYTLFDVMNYMFSWSGVQNYIRQHQQNPLLLIEDKLTAAWGNPNEKRVVSWHLHSKCARK